MWDMEHLTETEREELRAMLNAEKDSLEEELTEHGRKVNGDWQGNSAGFEGQEADSSDAADNIEELAVNIPLVEELESRFKEVLAALKRMEEGVYGLDESGDPIDVKRLRANPAATTNI